MIPGSKSSQLIKLKTEKAIQAVNQYQITKNESLFRTGIILTKNIDSFNQYTKEFTAKEIVRIQLLPKSRDFYLINYNTKIQPKIIIKNVRGGPFVINIYYGKISANRGTVGNRFTIVDQIIIRLDQKKTEETKELFIEFLNGSNLTMCNFRMDLQRKSKKKNLKTERSQSLISFLQTFNDKSPKLNEGSKSKSLKKIFTSQIDIELLKPQNRKKAIERQKQLEKEKKIAADLRKEKMQLFKQKQLEAKKLAAKCRSLVEFYESLIEEQQKIKMASISQNAPIIPLIKFAFLSTNLSIEREKKMNRIFMVKHYQRKFNRKLLMSYRQTLKFQPDSDLRQKTVISSAFTFLAKSFQRKNYLNSTQVVSKTILKCLPGIMTNRCMNAASRYRRFVRILQKRWRTKFQARMELLLAYAEKQIKVIFKKYPQFQTLEKQFQTKKMAYSICYQYQAETATKLKDLKVNYDKKLEEIEQFKQINKQIVAHNEAALKKRQKQLLQIPKVPTLPKHRFFRDLAVLKNMLRTWFEVQYRRSRKKNLSKTKINKIQEKK